MRLRTSDIVRVRLHCSWGDDVALREGLNTYTAHGDYRWRELALVSGDVYDVMVVFGHPLLEDIDPARTIVVECEPAPIRMRDRLRIPCLPEAFAAYYDVERHHVLGFALWPVGRLRQTPHKSRLLSAVVSSKSMFPPQVERLTFVTEYLSRLRGFDHFGRGRLAGPAYRGEVVDKADALLPYRYTFAAENWREPNYFSEKILDAIVCETLCFYDGCTNIELYLDPEVLVRVDVRKPDEALAIVEEAMARDLWRARLDAIRAQKHRLRTDLNPLEIIRKLVAREPVVWRPERDPLAGLDGSVVIRVDSRDPVARRGALERIARSDRAGVVLDDRAHLTDGAARVIEAVRGNVRAGDLVALGGTGVESIRHFAAVELPEGRTLRYAASMGEERLSAYCASPRAARAILREEDRLPSSVVLRSVDPPIAHLPGPFMRRDGVVADEPLVPPPDMSVAQRFSDAVVPRLPRGRRLAAATIQAMSLTGVPARHAWARLRG